MVEATGVVIQDLSPFLKLPGELRNQIYELVFCSARLDTVILINDLERRKVMRSFRSKNYKLDRTTKAMAKPYNIVNETSATITRLSLPIVDLPPIFETSILRVCRQAYQEARGFLANTTFAYYLPLSANEKVVPYPCPLIELSPVRRFYLEIQLPCQYPTDDEHLWAETEKRLCFFQSMSNLRQLQLVITYHSTVLALYGGSARDHATLFNSNWSTGLLYHDYSKLMRTIVKTIPKDIKVTCGLTQESLDIGNYGGFEPVDNAAIQGLYDMHKDEQGRHWSSPSKFGKAQPL